MNIFEKLKNGEPVDMMSEEYRPAVAELHRAEYGSGRGLQRAIDEGIVTREEVFITTKMWTSVPERSHRRRSLKEMTMCGTGCPSCPEQSG